MRSTERTARALVLVVALAACAPSESIDVSIDPGETKIVHIGAHCGFSTLELDVNGQIWSTNDLPRDGAGNPVEQGWEPPGEAGLYELEIALIDATTLWVTKPGSGVTHAYTPDPNPPGCA